MTTEKRREQQRQADRRKKAARRKLLSEFPCRLCNETDSDLIDWHHLDPETKSFGLLSSSPNVEVWWDEVLKCIPLCALCHRKLHTNKLCLLKSPTAYKRQAVTASTSAQGCTCPR